MPKVESTVNWKLKAACVSLYLVAFTAMGYGAIYISISTLLPYHQRYLEVPLSQLPPRVVPLFLLIYRGVGFAQISIGATLFMLVKGLLRKGDRWAWWIIAAMMGLTLIPLLFITRSVGPYTPWWGIGILIAIVSVALFIAWPQTTRR